MLNGTANLEHRLLRRKTYAAGRRVREVVRVRVSDIDSPRMLIRVEHGKGKKDRYTRLSPRLLVELRRYDRIYRPTEWWCTDRRRPVPMAPRSASRLHPAAKTRAGIHQADGLIALPPPRNGNGNARPYARRSRLLTEPGRMAQEIMRAMANDPAYAAIYRDVARDRKTGDD